MSFEKSPEYAEQFRNLISPGQRSDTELRAEEMKHFMPKVKLFMFVTDPVDRMFSHIKDCSNSHDKRYES